MKSTVLISSIAILRGCTYSADQLRRGKKNVDVHHPRSEPLGIGLFTDKVTPTQIAGARFIQGKQYFEIS